MVGAGNMGGAMLKGWMRAGILSPEQSAACTRSSTNASSWESEGLEVRAPSLIVASSKAANDPWGRLAQLGRR